MSELYKIKPLQWEKDNRRMYVATTPFGKFYIIRVRTYTGDDAKGKDKWEASYCFDEYFDEGRALFSTIRQCKAWAAAEWDERMQMCLEEVGK